jgi:uncharacterized surface protein with fasciclin (FAS1) repeats
MKKSIQPVSRVLAFLAISLVLAMPAMSAKSEKTGPIDKVTLLQTALAVSEASGDFNTLIAAVLSADPSVVMLLSDNGQHTVFAPTDAAFGALGLTPENVGDLDQETLTEILAYHVVKGRKLAEDVLAADKLNTLLRGKRGFIEQNGGVLTDNIGRTANIVVTDVTASNGVIHAIDAVVLPN